jgi:hypothetical protein
MMIFVAICTTRSRIVGIPSGLCFPSPLGMYRLRTGKGRYRFAFRVSVIPFRNSSTPSRSMSSNVS